MWKFLFSFWLIDFNKQKACNYLTQHDGDDEISYPYRVATALEIKEHTRDEEYIWVDSHEDWEHFSDWICPWAALFLEDFKEMQSKL